MEKSKERIKTLVTPETAVLLNLSHEEIRKWVPHDFVWTGPENDPPGASDEEGEKILIKALENWIELLSHSIEVMNRKEKRLHGYIPCGLIGRDSYVGSMTVYPYF